MYFSELIDSFDIFAISEHNLLAEQLEILEASTNYTITPTIALQSVLSYQANLRMAELRCFGKMALMIWLHL